jgi:uncharacterized protein (TIGR01244 family)
LKSICLLVAILLAMSACTHNHLEAALKSRPAESDLKIGDSLVARRYSDIYFSAQPTDADFQALKKQGFAAVINLRQSTEKDYSETKDRAKVEALGFTYKNIPTDSSQPITDEFIAQVTSAVKASRGKGKVLVHCSSGNRVAMWLGGHFHKDHGFSKKESLELAKKLGLNKQSAIERVETYLESN